MARFYKDYFMVREHGAGPYKWFVYRLDYDPEAQEHRFSLVFRAQTQRCAEDSIDLLIRNRGWRYDSGPCEV